MRYCLDGKTNFDSRIIAKFRQMAKGNSSPAIKKARACLYPCGICSEECFVDVILCNGCETWYHTNCQELTAENVEVLKTLPKSFLCAGCRSLHHGKFDFSRSLDRLYSASSGDWEDFHNAVKLEEILLMSHGTPLADRPPEPITSLQAGLSVDKQSQDLLAKNGGLRGYLPISVEGDGDALFRSVSVAMYGTNTAMCELRVRCVIEMVQNQDYYESVHEDDDLGTISPDYRQSCRDCATPQGASSAWTLHTVTSVIHIPILSVYPTVNGLMDKCVSILNNKFMPRVCQDKLPISIMWTRFGTEEEYPEGCWIPNHFVPLVPGSTDVSEQSTKPLLCGSSTPIEITPSELAADEADLDARMEQTQQDDGEEEEEQSQSADYAVTEMLASDEEGEVPTLEPVVIKREVEHSLPPASPGPPVKKRRHVQAVLSSPRPRAANHPPPADGGTSLVNGFLATDDLLKVLNTHEPGLPNIPEGLKQDVYFVIDNTKNLQRRAMGQRSIFSDDCGSYDTKSSSTKTTIFHYEGPGRMTYVLRRDGVYGRFIKKAFKALDPQPPEESIVEMKRYYGMLKRSHLFRKRVTWFVGLPATHFCPETMDKAIVEYYGPYPEEISIHGNCKKNYKVYTQRPLSSMDNSTEEILVTCKPKEAYKKLVADGKSPRDIRQIQNKRFNLMKKSKKLNKPIAKEENEQEAPMELEETTSLPFTNIVIDTNQEMELANTGQLVVEAVQNEGESATYYIIHTDNSTLEGQVSDLGTNLVEQITTSVVEHVDQHISEQIDAHIAEHVEGHALEIHDVTQ